MDALQNTHLRHTPPLPWFILLLHWAMLFSVLIDADRLDTELHRTGKERLKASLDPTALLTKLEEARRKRAADKTAFDGN